MNYFKKKGSIFGSPQSAKTNSSSAKQVVPTNIATATSTGCCQGTDGCSSSASVNVVPMNHHPMISKLEQQVAELEKRVLNETELHIMHKKMMERTQDYLGHCLQVAQDNGFLNLIHNSKDIGPQPCPPSSNVATPSPNAIPQFPATQPHHSSDLAAVTEQAQLNGWYIHPGEIEIDKKIGQGSTAHIYKGTWHGLEVAVKCMYPDFFETNDNGVAFFAQELDTLRRQRHPYILQLMGACLDPPNYAWVVTEFMSTTLKEWLHGPGNRRKERMIPLPPLKERVARALEIALAMQYLHGQRPMVIHRDLKPSNIFLDDAMHVRVADFGHARFLSDEEKALTGETGTYVYMAPEVIQCEPYNEKCDVYSFGILLNELITGDYPYIEKDYGPIKIAMEVVEENLRPKLADDRDGQLGELIDLICLSWNADASVRPSFAAITSSLKALQNRLFY
ncbi:hypothetical protein ACFXTH_016511 [Malus domestica]